MLHLALLKGNHILYGCLPSDSQTEKGSMRNSAFSSHEIPNSKPIQNKTQNLY